MSTPTSVVSLDKIVDDVPSTPGFRNAYQVRTRRPWYPLVGHREGLRANDLITLASAFWIISQSGGTAHNLACDCESVHCTAPRHTT